MRVAYENCCGADARKKSVVATIIRGAEGDAEHLRRSFGTLNHQLAEMRDWLLGNGCRDVCVEPAGVYWIPVFNVLEPAGIRVTVTNPKYVRAIKGKKTDAKDSRWIAELFRYDLVRSSSMPPPETRSARQLARHRFKLACMKTSEKNRFQNGMTISNIGLGTVLSDPLGKTARGVMEVVLASEGGELDEEACRKRVLGRAKRRADDIVGSLRGSSAPDGLGFKMAESLAHVEHLEDLMARAEAELRRVLEPHAALVRLIAGVPGVSDVSAMLIVAEIGADMSVFDDAAHLASWAGLAPGCNASAQKSKSSRTMRAGAYLKPLLATCANSAVKCKDDDCFARKYERVKARRGHKKAVLAIARMMLVRIYHMVANGECFNPRDRAAADEPARSRPAEPERDGMAEDEARRVLASLGYDLTSLVKL